MSATAKFTPPMSERAHTKGLTVGYPDGGITGPTSASVEGPTCAGRDWPYEIVTSGAETVAIFPAQVAGGIESARESAVLFAAAPDMFEALKKAREFIANGIELGFIRMPDAGTPDPAHGTLPAIEAALSKASNGEAVDG